jgi:hypothetical protein
MILGMCKSYQKQIWLTVWLNPNLKHLELTMAISPELKVETDLQWLWIDHKWKTGSVRIVEWQDLGDAEREGKLSLRYGLAEYLDPVVISQAKVDAEWRLGFNLTKMSIQHLSLAGLVVDNGPFKHHFDLEKLETVTFGPRCVDAGFNGKLMRVGGITVNKPRMDDKHYAVQAKVGDDYFVRMIQPATVLPNRPCSLGLSFSSN